MSRRIQRYRLDLSYDGSAFAGWQIQPGRTTVQQVVEECLARLLGSPVRAHASGRTDAGVHARQQVIHFDFEPIGFLNGLVPALNSLLPAEVRVMRAQCVSFQFHARLSAKAKEYRYFIYCGPVLPPFIHRYCWHLPQRLDIQVMQQAAKLLVGTHDFASFTANPNRPVADTRRHLSVLQVRKRGFNVEIRAQADGFLYKMARSLVGFLVRVGKGELAPSTARRILAARQRTAEVPTAPPNGLFLWRVYY